MPRASPTTYHHLNVRHHTPLFFTRPYLARLRTTAIRIPNTNGRIPLFSTAYKFYHKMIKCHIGIIRHCEYDKSIHHYRL